jgi:hypothetical protein
MVSRKKAKKKARKGEESCPSQSGRAEGKFLDLDGGISTAWTGRITDPDPDGDAELLSMILAPITAWS